MELLRRGSTKISYLLKTSCLFKTVPNFSSSISGPEMTHPEASTLPSGTQYFTIRCPVLHHPVPLLLHPEPVLHHPGPVVHLNYFLLRKFFGLKENQDRPEKLCSTKSVSLNCYGSTTFVMESLLKLVGFSMFLIISNSRFPERYQVTKTFFNTDVC